MQTCTWVQVHSLHGLSALGVSPQQAAGSKGAIPKGFLQAPHVSLPTLPALGLSISQLATHLFCTPLHTQDIEREMMCTEQHILRCGRRKRYPKTHLPGQPGAILTEVGAQPGFAPCLLPFPMPGLNLPWGTARVPRASVWGAL